MLLAEALDIENEKLVVLVGAGGKTSCLYLLGKEMAGQGKRVVLATTTKIFRPRGGEIPVLLDGPDFVDQLSLHLAGQRQVLVAGGVDGPKLTGLSCQRLLEVAALPQVDMVIVEGDGSRGLPLKFPAPHEPVVCSADAAIVLVVGITALGRKLNESSCQRWELLCEYNGVEEGARITPELVAAALYHPEGYGRFLGKNRVIPLLNQVENREQEDAAWMLARLLLSSNNVDRIVVGAVRSERIVGTVIQREGR